jgi:beta-glucosidase
LDFGKHFVWGAATAAYQIEGAIHEDGRSESIWDRFCKKPGAIVDGSSGANACDHYRLWRRDIAHMKWLGLGAYRFSLAWPRILPKGRGRINERGFIFYERLVDALLELGVEPYVTLYHWDLPQVLEDAGGWPARATAQAFAEYADVVTRRLGDRVKNWITHNEPWCISMLGYRDGIHAPGKKDPALALAAAHHVLVSHGWALHAIRANVSRARAGIALNLVPVEPASESAADADACRASDGSANRWFLDPLYGRGYPADVIRDRREDGSLSSASLPFVQRGDLDAIGLPTDFLGVNYYVRHIARSSAIPEEQNARPTRHLNDERTAMGWEVYPEGLERILRQVHDQYHPACIYVTENGAAYNDPGPNGSGPIADPARLRFIRRHLQAAGRAIRAGVPLEGYFLWSLMDNFEWAMGYTKRFGILWVDYTTQDRSPKESAHFYRRVIARNGLEGAP